jgi:hypothetical protein
VRNFSEAAPTVVAEPDRVPPTRADVTWALWQPVDLIGPGSLLVAKYPVKLLTESVQTTPGTGIPLRQHEQDPGMGDMRRQPGEVADVLRHETPLVPESPSEQL